MRVIVHAGMQKTGSSALQDHLAAIRPNLASMGVSYPDFGHRGHWLVTAAFVAHAENYHHFRRRMAGEDAGPAVSSMKRNLKKIIAAGGPDKILILSHEDLSVSSTARRLNRFLKKAAGGAIDTEFLAYVRHPLAMFPSAIQQALKSGRDRTLLPSEWVNPHHRRATNMYKEFGQGLTLKVHSPPTIVGWDVMEDFLSYFLARTGVVLPQENSRGTINTSVSAEGCALLELGRSHGLPDAIGISFRRAIRTFDETRAGKSKLIIPADWIDSIIAVNAPSWNEVLTLIDLDEDTKQILHLPESGCARHFTDDDLKNWILSYLDLDYTTDLLTYCGAAKASETNDALIAWLERTVGDFEARG